MWEIDTRGDGVLVAVGQNDSGIGSVENVGRRWINRLLLIFGSKTSFGVKCYWLKGDFWK